MKRCLGIVANEKEIVDLTKELTKTLEDLEIMENKVHTLKEWHEIFEKEKEDKKNVNKI